MPSAATSALSGAPLRIVYVWDADYPWDVRTEKICASLTQAGHEVHIVARNRAWAAAEERLPEGVVHRMAPLRWTGKRIDTALGFPAFCNPRWYRLISRTVKRVHADLLIVRDLPLCPTAIWAAQRAGLPVVLDMAENYPAMIRDIWIAGRSRPLDALLRNPALVKRVEDWCLPRLDGILVVVEESGQRLEAKGVPVSRLRTVSNVPPRARAQSARSVRPHEGDDLELVYLGIMEIPRGVGELIESVALLRAQGVPVRARLIGGGRDLEYLRTKAASLNLDPAAVEFCGVMPSASALATVARADIGVVPHHASEAWHTTVPNKLFDYWAAGLPVVTSDTKPCSRLARETGGALVFRAGSATALAAAIDQLRDPVFRARLGEAGRQAILARHNWEAATAVLLSAVAAWAAPEG